MKRLSIAIVLDDKFPSSSGVSRSIQTQIEELSRLGHDLTLIAPKTELEAPENAHVIPVSSISLPGLPQHTRILCASNRAARTISRQHHFDIIHSQTDTGALLLAAKIARLQNIPHVHTFHTNMAGSHTVPVSTFFASIGFRIYALLVSRIHRRRLRGRFQPNSTLKDESRIGRFDWRTQAIIAHAVDASTAPSHYLSKYIQAAAGDTDLHGAMIPTGYNRTFESYARQIKRNRQKNDKTVRFISISRLVKEKRLGVVIAAFKKATIPNGELLIVGDGAEYKNLTKQAEGVSNIKFTGHISDRKQIVQLLRDSDVFVLASYRFDNQPIVIPESLVVGVPILYCDDRLDVGLNDKNSLLSKPGVDDLAQSFVKIADFGYRQKLIAGTKSVFDELSPQATATAYLKLYEKTAAKYQ